MNENKYIYINELPIRATWHLEDHRQETCDRHQETLHLIKLQSDQNLGNC